MSEYNSGPSRPPMGGPVQHEYDARHEEGVDDDYVFSGDSHGGYERPRRRRRRGGGGRALLVLLVFLALLIGGGFWAYGKIRSHFQSAPDYPGPGSGQVLVQVKSGETVAQIGNDLRRKNVVESVDGFVKAANANPKADSIQVGFYQLKHQMRSSDALNVLIDPKNLIQAAVTIPEGYRLTQIVDAIVAHTKLTRHDVKQAIKNADQLGLPAAAGGNPEGWLFPATYTVPPNMTADDLVRQMIGKTVSVLNSLDVNAKAQKLGLSEEQVLTVASILEYEARRAQDYPKVARAIYNRLKDNMPLQSDATVAYATQSYQGKVTTTDAQRNTQSPYNTYLNTGLPPGPIGSAGEVTLNAALNPANGPWKFWVVVNLQTGETDFATTYAQHQQNVAKFQAYCQTHNCGG